MSPTILAGIVLTTRHDGVSARLWGLNAHVLLTLTIREHAGRCNSSDRLRGTRFIIAFPKAYFPYQNAHGASKIAS